MGCGFMTCAITRLPITYNEECVMIDFSQCPIIPGEMFTEIGEYGPHITRILKGNYDDYGSLEGLEESKDNEPYRVFFKKKAWDEIVKLYPRRLLPEEISYIEHKKDLDSKLNKSPKDDDDYFCSGLYYKHLAVKRNLTYIGEYVSEWFSVYHFMQKARLNLDSWFWGYTQNIDTDAHKYRMDITATCYNDYISELDIEPEAPDSRDVFCYDCGDKSSHNGSWWDRDFAEKQGWKFDDNKTKTEE